MSKICKIKKLKIISGSLKGRNIFWQEQPNLRPTSSRVRETLFNWLQLDINNSSCIDLCAGSGILSFEAISRGANKVIAIDTSEVNCKNLLKNKQHLNLLNYNIINQDAMQFLDLNKDNFDIAFVDPPYNNTKLFSKLLEQISLCINKFIYWEFAEKLSAVPENWQIKHLKKAGKVIYGLLERQH